MAEMDQATRASLSLALQMEFGISLEDIESFTKWYLDAYADYPPGNRIVDSDGYTLHPETRRRWRQMQ